MYADALLFDLDGVLVDSAECVRRVCTNWAMTRGLDPVRVLAFSQGRRVQETVRTWVPHLDFDAEVAMLVALEARTTDGLRSVPGAAALIASLPPNAWAVVTSGARQVATLRLSHVGLPVPPTLVTADDVRLGKPDPEGYLAAAKALGCDAKRCVVVEDAPAGIQAAHAAGMRSIGIASTFAAAQLQGADMICDRLDQLRVERATSGGRLRLRATN